MPRLVKWLASIAVLAFCGVGCSRPAEVVVSERAGSNFNLFVIEDEAGIRRLRFERDGVDQSAVVLGQPGELVFAYTRALVTALALRPSVRRVLVIGLGGGSFPMFLRSHLPSARIDVVDIDPAVLEVARHDLGFREDPQMVVHIADGRQFIEASSDKWDLIVLDAYGPDEIPEHLATRPFYEVVRRHLEGDGLVAANLWSEYANPRYTSMLRTFERVFPEVHVIAPPRSESRVILASPSPLGLDRDRLVAFSVELKRRWNLRFDLPALVRRGYSGPRELPPGGRVLEDSAAP
jgi:spermidine synthase